MRSRSIVMRVLGLAGFAVAYVVAARFGLLLSFEGTNASPVWPPSGIGVAAVVIFGPWASVIVTAGAFISNVWSFSANQAAGMESVLLMSAVISVGNTLEALVGGMLLRKSVPGHPLLSIADVYRFLGVAAFVSLISAGFGNISLFMGGVVAPDTIMQVMATWWVGDFVGIMVITPLCLLVLRNPAGNIRNKLRHTATWIELLLCAAAVTGLALLVFQSGLLSVAAERLLLFFFFPLLAWLAYRYGMIAVNPMIFVSSVLAVLGTIHGTGPFRGVVLNSSLISLELFVLMLCLAGMLLSADSILLNSYESSERKRWVFRSHWLALLLALAATVAGWHGLVEDTLASHRRAFRFYANELVSLVSNRMVDYAQILRSAAGFFSSSEYVTYNEWKRYFLIEQIERNYPGILGLGYGAFLPHKDLAAFVAAQRLDGRPNFTVRPQSENAFHAPVTYLEPETAPNQGAFGFDMYSEALRRQAMDEASASGDAAITSLITLVQEPVNAPQPGMILYFPVYRHGVPVDTYDERKRALKGFIYAPFRAHEMFGVTLANRLGESDIRIWDGNIRNQEHLLFQSSDTVRNNALFSFDGIITVGNHSWSVEQRSTAAYETTVDETKATVFLIAGMIISMLLFTAMRSLTATRAEALRFADTMSSTLAEKNAFQQSILDNVESSIISTTVGGLVTSFSKGAERLLGFKSDEVVGKYKLTIFHDPEEIEARARELREEGGAATDFELLVRNLGSYHEFGNEWTYVTKDGTRIPVMFTMSAIANRDGKVSGYLAVARNLTETKKTLEALRESEAFNRSIVENTRDRIFIMDKKGTIVDSPASTREALGLGDALIVVGTEWWQLWKTEHSTTAQTAFEQAAAGHPVKMQGQLNTLEKGELWWDVSMTPMFDARGNVEKVLAVLRDFTAEYQRDSAIRKLNSELEERINERTLQLRESNVLLKAHSDELEERQQFLQTITDNIPATIGYWTKGSRRLAFANKGYFHWTGKTPEELIGKTYIEVVGEQGYNISIPFFEAAMAGEAKELERMIKRPNGEIGYVYLSYIPHVVNDEVVGLFAIGIDTTKTKMAEMEVQKLNEILQMRIREKSDELYATESLFSSAMTASSAGMAIVDKNNCYARTNPAMCNFLSYNELELTGKSIFDTIADEDQEMAHEVIDALWHGETFSARLEQRYVRQDGRVLWGLLNLARVVNTKGETEHLVIHVADINQEKQLEKEMEELISRLKDQKEELERSNKELDSFAYAASHDLKSPLRGIGNLAAWIEEDLGTAISEDIRKNLQLMRKRISQMEVLLQDLLTYAKAGRGDDPWQKIDLLQKIQEIWGLTGGSDRFELETEGEFSIISTPRVALEQVLRNLISNAVKHHDKETGTIKVSISRDAGNYRFKVSDDGPGIKKEFHQKIFAMFQTLKSKDESQGSGIGLALVKKIIERYGGTIEVESDGTRGTTFSFSWPAEIAL